MAESASTDDKPPATPSELPEPAPDFYEAEHPEEVDDAVPTAGYRRGPVVGIGGSAGSIQALRQFFEHAPAAAGIAYVVVLHLAPEHESLLPALLQRHTSMPVSAAQDGEAFQADRVHVIPPGKHLVAVDGQLQLHDLQQERGKRVAVDLFFRSLADSHGAHATAVVLSGADGDGAVGLKRIKERGGLTIAQDPQEAEHPSMPSSAIATGMVDWILKAAEMPGRIAAYVQSERRLHLPPEDGPRPAAPLEPPADPVEAQLREVLALLRTLTACDFSYYKRATIVRRIARRMQVSGVSEMADYLDHLRTHPGEAGALLQDLLISVTNFFRDREAFQSLETRIPELFRDKQPGDSLRVWCAACATGEEAYSMAMLLLEHAGTLQHPPTLQVFGCDLSEQAIQVARAGFYPDTIVADVSDERLRRFFTREPGGWRVRREVREMVLFANHDLLRDAPFSRMDLVSCRNLLIYLNRDAQQRAIEIFHFALKPGGLMFMGASESIADDSALFGPVDKRHRIFRQKPVQRAGVPLPIGAHADAIQRVTAQHERLKHAPTGLPGRGFAPATSPLPPLADAATGRAVPDDLHLQLLGRYGPASLIVDERHEIVRVSEGASRFLAVPEGGPTHDVLRLVHPALRIELRLALLQAAEAGQPVKLSSRQVDLPEGPRDVEVRVIPIGDLPPRTLFVMLETREPETATPAASDGAGPPGSPEVVQRLERELIRANATLRETIERHAISTEELKAGNEELQAMNEELRSAGEELETGREELQSVNEELNTVNAEFRGRAEELARTNSDLQNLMSATHIATVFLGRELEVRRYTPAAAPLFNLIPSDVGRPITHLHRRLDYPQLQADADRVLETLQTVQRELREGERWFLARVQPYRTADDHIAGVVLSFVDITERRRAEEALRESEEAFRLFVTATSESVYRMTADWSEMRLLVGKNFLADTRVPKQTWLEEYIPEGDRSRVRAAINEAIRTKTPFQLEHRVVRADASIGWTASRAIPLLDAHGEIVEWFGTASDLTERRRTEAVLHESEARLRLAIEASDLATWEWNLETDEVTWNERHFRLFGMVPEDRPVAAQEFFRHVHPEDQARVGEELKRAIDAQKAFHSEFRSVSESGELRWMSGYGRVVRVDAHGKPTRMSGVMIDISQRRQEELALHESQQSLRLIVENAREYAMVTMTTDRRITGWNTGARLVFGFSAEEAIGRLIDIIFTPEDRAAAVPEQEVAQTLESGASSDERWHVRKDGSRFWASGVISRLRDANGVGVGLMKICRDQTAQQQGRQAIEAARDEAQAAAQIKDRFLAMLSHELRTPLTPALLAVQVLTRNPEVSPAARKTLGIIQRNIGLQMSLVDELLDVTRIAAGKLDIQPVGTTLREVIDLAVEVSAPDISAKQQRLAVELAAGQDAIQGDPKRLQQAFWNLLKNASKFTPEGGEIRVTSRLSPERATVEVSDTGVGFDPARAERLFDVFEQASPDITKKFGGLGLGLAIARGNIEAHGGTIHAASEGVGRGATFTVELPLSMDEQSGSDPVRRASM